MKRYILLAATALTLAACTNDEVNTATDGPVALKVNAPSERSTPVPQARSGRKVTV